MATVRALAATGEKITKTERAVTSALAGNVIAFLPAITSGESVAGDTIKVSSSSTGSIELQDLYGHRIALCPAGRELTLEAQADSQWAEAKAGSTRLSLATGDQSTGSTAAVLTANSPSAATAIKTWMSVTLADGTVGFVPVWQ